MRLPQAAPAIFASGLSLLWGCPGDRPVAPEGPFCGADEDCDADARCLLGVCRAIIGGEDNDVDPGSGRCESPLLAALGEQTGSTADPSAAATRVETRCADAPGAEQVWLFEAPGPGTVHVTVTTENWRSALVLSARSTCTDAQTELGCALDADAVASLVLPLDEPGPVHVIVDGAAVGGGGAYTLAIAFIAEGCGDGQQKEQEVCDGADLADTSCLDLGFVGGELACATDCDSFDTAGCVASLCGNGIIDEDEACDGDDLGDQGCEDLGFSGGVLACEESCEALFTGGCEP